MSGSCASDTMQKKASALSPKTPSGCRGLNERASHPRSSRNSANPGMPVSAAMLKNSLCALPGLSITFWGVLEEPK